ncbi:MAG TPA: hypothetical protein VG944_16960 [Fimbriimonas sp.]|nr:hypothetical protein [Fimbriimonas sp.]
MLLGLSAVSCSQSPSIVGTWTGKVFDQDSSFEFKEDKTVSADVKMDNLDLGLTGTYEITPKVLAITFSKDKPKGVDDKVLPMAETMIKPLLNKGFSGAYHFNSADEVAFTVNNKTDILKRQKQDQG